MNADNHYTKGKMVLNIIIHTYYRCYNLQTPFCSLRIRYELSCLYSNSKTMVSPFIVMIYAAHFPFTCPLLCQSSVPGIIDIFSFDFIAHQMKTPIRVKTFFKKSKC